jgi:hypothetical protein
MDVKTLIAQLESELETLKSTIATLKARVGDSHTNATRKQVTNKAAKPHGRVWSAADRNRMSKIIKARFAAKKRNGQSTKKSREAGLKAES